MSQVTISKPGMALVVLFSMLLGAGILAGIENYSVTDGSIVSKSVLQKIATADKKEQSKVGEIGQPGQQPSLKTPRVGDQFPELAGGTPWSDSTLPYPCPSGVRNCNAGTAGLDSDFGTSSIRPARPAQISVGELMALDYADYCAGKTLHRGRPMTLQVTVQPSGEQTWHCPVASSRAVSKKKPRKHQYARRYY